MKNNILVCDLGKLQQYLVSIGLTLVTYDLKNPTNVAGNPLVLDGLNGIRATQKRNVLKIWFTNKFEKSDNDIRILVEQFILSLNK